MLRATAALRQSQSMLRPAMVTEYGDKTSGATSFKWQLFRVVTALATTGCGLTMALVQEYPGSSRTGEHVFTNVRRAYLDDGAAMPLGFILF